MARRLASRHASEIWLDVGAHEGQRTIREAVSRAELLVYAFEPDLRIGLKMAAVQRNFVVLPFAVASNDGVAEFHLNAFQGASSLLPLDPSVGELWAGGSQLREIAIVSVPTIRIDTFMDLAAISHVAYMKVDVQGTEMDVLSSAGGRLADIWIITVEAPSGAYKPYLGATDRADLVAFLEEHAFRLVASELQSEGQEENLTFVNSRAPRNRRRIRLGSSDIWV